MAEAGYTRGAEMGRTVVRLTGRVDTAASPALLSGILSDLGRDISGQLIADLSGVEFMDDYGALLLYELRRRAEKAGGSLELRGVPDAVDEMLRMVRYEELVRGVAAAKPGPDPFLVRLGGAGLEVLEHAKKLFVFLGEFVLAALHVLAHPRSIRWGDTLTYMKLVGVDAVPIVGLISFLLGLIMAFMSSVQLKQFGANIYVASLVGLSMARELGPIMTCIIVAGRSGSAFAAEIGTKQVNEEVDALTTMGFDVFRFLVMPKLIATFLVVPVLTLMSNVFANAGGLIVGVGMLELTGQAYINQLGQTLSLFDVLLGVTKSGAFAILIALVGCYKGLQVRGGADSVGRATTSAVVNSIFLIILADAVAAVIDRYWG